MSLHQKSGSGPPAGAPETLGEHYVDTANGVHYLSVGTDTAADWQQTASPTVQFNDQATTAYTLTASDNGKTVTLANSNPITLTLPETATEPLVEGFQCRVIQFGAGQVTLAVEGSDTLETLNGKTSIAGENGRIEVLKLVDGNASTWGAYGDLA